MFEDIISLKNLFEAWLAFRSGKQKRSDVRAFERSLEDNVFDLREALRTLRYRHGAYERFHIFDPKHRVIHKAMVRDRVVHHAVYRVLAPMIERSFIFDSYSCRIGKGTHAALDRLELFVRRVSVNFTQPCWALKCDIKKFFDSIDHDVLLTLLRRYPLDSSTQQLLEEIIKSFPPVDKIRERERESYRHSDRQFNKPAFC